MKEKLRVSQMFCFIYICNMASCGCSFITSMMTSQKDDNAAFDPVPNPTISIRYKCSQCSFQCDDKSSAADHSLMHRSSPFKIRITSYGPNGYFYSQTRYEGEAGYLLANMQTSEPDHNVQGHEIVIRSGFNGERMYSDVKSDASHATSMQYTTQPYQTAPSDSRPRASIFEPMLTGSHSTNSTPIYAEIASVTKNKRERMSSSSGVVETGTFGSCMMPQMRMQQGGFVSEECSIHFDKQESSKFHETRNCALSRKRLFTETSVATCKAQEPVSSESFPHFSETVPSPMTSVFMPGSSASGGINAKSGSGIVPSNQLPQDMHTCAKCNINFYQYETYVRHVAMWCESNRSRLMQTAASSTSQMHFATECESNHIKTYSCILCEYKGTKLQMRLHASSHKFEGDRAVEAYLLTFVVEEPASLKTHQSNDKFFSDWRELTSSLSIEDLYLYIGYSATRRNRESTNHQPPPYPQPSTSRSEASSEFLL